MAGVGAVVLAGGGGARFTGPTHKLMAPFRGSTVVEHALAAAIESDIGPVAAVTGPPDLLLPAGVEVLANSRWSVGQATSLAVAVEWATGLHLRAIVVGLGDQPLVGPDAWRAVSGADSPIAVATFAGVRSPPVRLSAEIWPLLPGEGDEGARTLIRDRPDLVVEVPCSGNPADIDTVEDLARWG